ncbi:MAG: efflux RND transporter permease subunit, partial [Bacteroidetes bacterium]|nr:efflux RND transporter permease subunit [Bacteroidota bacterium]
EGDLLFMPVTDPAISLDEATRIMQKQDEIIKSFPEVEWSVGKAGRAETSTDPSPINMTETIVHLKPESEWRPGLTREKLVTEMDAALRIPGVTNIWTQPIINRIEMLATGIRSQVGIKVFGNDLNKLEEVSREIAGVVRQIPGAADVYPEQIGGAPYIDIDINRQAAARYGVDVGAIQEVIEKGIGESNLTVTIEGRRRFPIRVRYAPEFRQTPEAIGNIPIATPSGATVPLSNLAEIRQTEGAAMINSENGLLRGTVLLNVRGRDIGSFIAEVEQRIQQNVALPEGTWVRYGGQFENLQRAVARLRLVVPLALLLIVGLLYLTLGSWKDAALVFTGVPLALTGGIAALALRDLPFSISAGVGFIALSGVAVLNGLVMITFINQLRAQGRSLDVAIAEGAQIRLRPVLMTALVASLGFVPMALATGAGAEVQRPLATVVIGGILSSTLLTLVVLPVLYRLTHRDLPAASAPTVPDAAEHPVLA